MTPKRPGLILSRASFLNALSADWAILPDRLEQLSPSGRKTYLEKQGYPDSPQGLLGHILAWWEDGSRVIERMRREPGFENPDYDVDTFNARAVARFGLLSLPEAIAAYQAMHEKMVALVAGLSDAEMLDERINNRLRYEIIVHLEEHPLPTPG
jgi:hypothetical protein